MKLSKKVGILMGVLLITAVAALAVSQDKKPNEYFFSMDTNGRWPVESNVQINGDRPWEGQGSKNGALNTEDYENVELAVNWAEVHTGKSYTQYFNIPFDSFREYNGYYNTIDVFIKIGRDGEIIVGTGGVDFNVQEIVSACANRTPEKDSSFEERIALRKINSAESINSWKDKPLPPTTCPEPKV